MNRTEKPHQTYDDRTTHTPTFRSSLKPRCKEKNVTSVISLQDHALRPPQFIWKKELRKVMTTKGLVNIPSLYQICRYYWCWSNSRYCNLYFKRLLRNKFSLRNGSLSMVCIQANKSVLKATLHSHLPSLGHHLPRARCLAYWTLCAVNLPRAHLTFP